MADQAVPKNVEAIHRLTPVQEGILFHAEGGDEAEGVYLLQFTCLLVGALDRQRFADAWRAVIERHAALRTLYTWRGRPHPLGVVRKDVPFELDWIDDRPQVVAEDQGEALAVWMGEQRRAGLDLERAPVFRVSVAASTGERARLLWTFHHVSLDGWSMRVVLDEVLRAYGGEDLAASPPGPGQAAMVDWLGAQDVEPGRAHWRARFEGWEGPRFLDLGDVGPTKRRGAHGPGSRSLERRLVARLSELARDAGVTPAVVARAAWALVLSRLTDTSDVVFGTTVAGRPPGLAGIEDAVGMFIGTIPVRCVIPWERPVRDWLGELHADQLADSVHEHVSLPTIQREVTGGGGGELFDALLVVENHAARTRASDGLTIEQPRFVERSHYDLVLLVEPTGSSWELTVLCGSNWWRSVVLGLVTSMLEELCTDPEGSVAAAVDRTIDADDEERPEEDVPPALPDNALELLLRGGTAARAAVVLGDMSLDWETFRTSVAAVTRRLGAAGLGPGARLGLRMERSADALIAMVAALRAGVVYAPIDPEAPPERVASMVRSAGMDKVIAGLDDLPPDQGGADPAARALEGLAYILFTSGSTGEPKGVEVTLEGLVRSTLARRQVYGESMDVFLLLSPLHFDSSVAGLYWTLLSGGTLVMLAPGEERDPAAILDAIERHGVTHTLMLPSLWLALLETESPRLGGLDTVIVAGEACTDALVEKHFGHLPGTRLFNEYGPTEATVWATVAEARPGRPIGIGQALPDVLAWMVDHRDRPVEIGTVGELALAGPTLARGYAGDPARTDAAFPMLECPPHGMVRAYRTGDRVRERLWGGEWRDRLEYHGRGDDQVKIRGQRIELGEVESAAAGAPGVAEAAATTAGAAGARRLLLYVRGVDGALPEVDAVLDWLRFRLSGAMLPSDIIALKEFPRTATGKVDRGALRDAALLDPESQAAGRPGAVEPREALEGAAGALANVWTEVLGLESFGPDDDFFALGGDSLTSIRLLARAHRLGVKLTPAEFAEEPTIQGMLRRSTASSAGAAPLVTRGGTAFLPAQRWFLEHAAPATAAGRWNFIHVVTFKDEDPSTRDVQQALDVLALRHLALRTPVDQASAGQLRPGEPSVFWSVPVSASMEVEADPIEAVHSPAATPNGAWLAAGFLPREAGASSGRQLLLSAAHFAVDALSMAILEDELRAILAGETLGAAPAPAGAWGAELERFAASEAGSAELDHWLALEDAAVQGLEFGDAGTVADEGAAVAALDPARSRQLAGEAHAALGTTTLDLLVLAVARAAGGRRDRVLLEMETHGREAHLSGLDVSRTVGWFTALWPHVVHCGGTDIGAQIQRTKDDLRAVPGRGAGFGPLRWSHPDPGVRERLAGLPEREVLLNHMGTTDGPPVPDESVVGALRAPELPRGHAVEVLSWVDRVTGELFVRVALSRRVHGEERAGEIARAVVTELGAIIDHCVGADGPGATPSDFPLAGLDQAGLDRLGDLLGD